ncbi:RiPP maturation radical SAM C-methyltransferase [Kitasatospora kifunensis]
MRIALVSMPWHLLATPSLPLGILQVQTEKCRSRHDVRSHFLNLRWAEHLYEVSDGAITPDDYDYVANIGVWHGMGDWVFTSALYGTPHWRRDRFRAYLAEHGVNPGKSEAMAGHAADFVTALARELVAEEPDVIGFSSTFQQNVPSLAMAKAIKEIAPHIPILLGGGNCDAPMGPALQRNFPFVDYVISGEAEQSYVEFIDHLDGELPAQEVHGLSWTSKDGATVTNPPGPLLAMRDVPCPDFGDYFSELEKSPVRSFIKPTLLYEAARGCWWGEKHTCTFCGLNGLTMKFRSRPPEQARRHLQDLVERHRILDIVAVDNILDMAYLRTLLPELAAADLDLNFYYEVKSNLGEEDVAGLRAAGLVHIQPGIENLSSDVLKIMDKGVHATQNIRLLRSCEEHDVTVDWNYLYGFPGEREGDYAAVLDQLPALSHLQPPVGRVRILLERYSPYFERPELGFPNRRPAALYGHVYDLPEAELQDIVYQFDSPAVGVQESTAVRLRAAIMTWRQNYPASSLLASCDEQGTLLVEDRRVGWPQRLIRLESAEAAAYQVLRTPRNATALRRQLADQGHDADASQVESWLGSWKKQGLVFESDGRFVALATNRASIKRGALPAAQPAAPVAGEVRTVSFVPDRARETLEFIGTLRDHTSRAQVLPWRTDLSGLPDPRLLYHLSPPGQADQPAELDSWRQAHRYGLLHYRRGPGFVVVHDSRPGARRAEIILDTPESGDLLDHYATPRPLPTADHPTFPAVQDLLRDDLLLALGGLAVALPYRLHRLPLPIEVLGHG